MQGAILALVVVMAFRSAGRNSPSVVNAACAGHVTVSLCFSVISMSILYVLTLHHRGDVTAKDG